MSAWRVAISREGAKKSKKSSKVSVRSAEVLPIARDLGTLALARVKQEGQISIRQREQLRRAFAAAGDALGWSTMMVSHKDPVEKASKDLLKLAQRGTESLIDDMEASQAAKKTEVTEIKKVAKSLFKMAKADNFTEAVDVDYIHTARDGSQGYLTKTITATISNAKEAQDLGESLEKKLEGWEKLREQMQNSLKEKRKTLDDVKASLPAYIETSRGLLKEVFLTIQ